MSFYTCWDVKPTTGRPGMPLAELVARLADAFPVHEFDPEGARQNALRRLDALQNLPFQVPEDVLASYRNAHPVDVFLADAEEEHRAALDFTIWPEKDGSVTGLQICFGSEEHQREAAALLTRLAEVLSWEPEDVSDEVA
ncbi:hypothetical protein R5W24_003663 [Gemmata sp. JC717]|uniref:hypothetical protein n=1 Tax=Gemmata algarum TaxID=2975278 RepID=UPI0021BB6609|nr:hypothetical protein [Gemmata algarum]MDY3554539.1 hypothetical protein [Gemmata algarum]